MPDSVRIPVLPPTDVFLVKLRSLSEHHCDFTALLPAARAIREQLDWSSIERQTADNDFACAFLVLARRLPAISVREGQAYAHSPT